MHEKKRFCIFKSIKEKSLHENEAECIEFGNLCSHLGSTPSYQFNHFLFLSRVFMIYKCDHVPKDSEENKI